MKKLTLSLLAAFAACIGAFAQSLDNPALNANLENGFVRIGEFRSYTRNNVGASSFIFPSGDKLVTGLHSSVSSDQFLGGLKPVNSLFSQIDYNLVSYGWKGGSLGGFHTVDVGAKGHYGASVPKEIFQILKTGTAESPYDLSSFTAFGNLYAEIAYGYSMPINDKLSVGARVKLLLGLNSVDVSARKFELTTTEDEYKVDLDADIDLTSRNKKLSADENGYLDYTSFKGKGKLGIPTGAGLAMDLGLVWKPFNGFTLSASLLDLGGILWYYGNGGKSSGTYTFDGLKEMSTDEFEQDKLVAKLKETGEEVLKVIRPKTAEKSFKAKAVPFTAKLDACYAMPFWSNLSVNCSSLYTGYSFCAPYWEARGGLAVDFPGIARVGMNAGGGAYGFVWGGNASVDFLSFRLFASYENGIGGVIPYENTPLKANNKSLVIGLVYKL